MNLFGTKKKSTQAQAAANVNPVDTIRKLRDNLETLDKREAHIYKKVEAALLEAKQKAAKKDKKGALFALKRKKMYENEAAKLQGAKITMESQIMALESASINIETFKAMKSGADAMKAIRGNIDADKVEDMMDEMEEERELHDQISDAISRPAGDVLDDEDLLNELNELEALELEANLELDEPVMVSSNSGSRPIPSHAMSYNLPEAPVAKIPVAPAPQPVESEDERTLRELQASMLA